MVVSSSFQLNFAFSYTKSRFPSKVITAEKMVSYACFYV